MELLIHLLVLGLATWRLNSYLTSEQGANGICAKFRSLIGLKFERGEDIPKNWFANEITCPWCFSIYPGLLFTILYLINKDVAFWIALPFALSTVSILVNASKTITIYMKHLQKGQ